MSPFYIYASNVSVGHKSLCYYNIECTKYRISFGKKINLKQNQNALKKLCVQHLYITIVRSELPSNKIHIQLKWHDCS